MSTEQTNPSLRFSGQRLLVASPHAGGTPYERRVVFLLEHSARGAMGIVVNDQLRKSVQQLRGRSADPLLRRAGVAPRLAGVPVGVFMWGPGQLEAELKKGIWLSSPAKLDGRVAQQPNLWVDLLRQIGRSVLCDALQLDELPPDPTVN